MAGLTRKEARTTLAKLIRRLSQTPRSAAEAYQAADLAIDYGLEDEAVDAVARSTAAVGREPRLWQMLALLYRALERSSLAIQAFERAATLAPSDARIAHGLALATMEAGLPASARFERARLLAPTNDELLLGHAQALASERQAKTGLDLLRMQLRIRPDWFAGHEGFAKLAAQGNGDTPATETIDSALRDHPGNLALALMRLAIIGRTASPSTRLREVSDARCRIGNHPALWIEEAIAASEAGEIAHADRLFKAIGRHDNPQLGLAQLRHLCRAQRFDQVDALAALLASGPESVSAWAYRHTAWRLTGDPRLSWLDGASALVQTVDLSEELNLEMLTVTLQNIHIAAAQPLDQSVRGGTQTEGPLFARIEPAIHKLKMAVKQAIARYIEALPPKDPEHPLLSASRGEQPRFAGSWSVRLQGKDQGHHVNHIHGLGWLSSAFYVALPPVMSKHEGALTIGAPPDELGLALEPMLMIPPACGRLVLFPSYIWHGVTPFSGGERLTVAFDIARPRD